MIELAKHIETLLLENDCVIVPGLGGFITHCVPAKQVAEQEIFYPPMRVIGFNPQLKINDGILAQSYMHVYGIDFSAAMKMIESQVKKMRCQLHEDGKVVLPNIGELHYSIHQTYDFVPYDNKLSTPSLYGWGCFEMEELSVLQRLNAHRAMELLLTKSPRKVHHRRFHIERSMTSVLGAVAVVILLFLCFPVPVQNTGIMNKNYALLLPNELFSEVGGKSMTNTPIALEQSVAAEQKNEEETLVALQSNSGKENAIEAVPSIRANELKVKEKSTTSPSVIQSAALHTQSQVAPQKSSPVTPSVKGKSLSKPYHIIVASVGSAKDAAVMAARLVEEGHKEACALIGDGKNRVCIESFESQTDARERLTQLRQDETYLSAWILKQ